jgi:hypothetical protein
MVSEECALVTHIVARTSAKPIMKPLLRVLGEIERNVSLGSLGVTRVQNEQLQTLP